MNICLISREYPPETGWGGIGTYTYNMAHALAQNKNHVTVISCSSDFSTDYFDKKVHVFRIKTPNPHFVGNCLKHSCAVFNKLSQLCDDFDLIEAPEFRAEGLVSVYHLDVPLITRLHTPTYLLNKLSIKKNSFRFHSRLLNDHLLNFLEKAQTTQSAGVTAPSKAILDEIAMAWKIKTSNIKIIPNGIDVKRIRSIKTDDFIEAISTGPAYIAYVGRVEARKGVLILAMALPFVFEKFPNLKVLFIGDYNPFRNDDEKKIVLNLNFKHRNNIIFTGYVKENHKLSLIKGAKLVVLPSLWEAFGYTCLEAMALSKTVIATRGSGFEEIIEDTTSGFLVRPNDYKDLQKRIVACLENECLLRSIENAAGQRAQDFDVTKISQACNMYYKEIKQNRSKR